MGFSAFSEAARRGALLGGYDSSHPSHPEYKGFGFDNPVSEEQDQSVQVNPQVPAELRPDFLSPQDQDSQPLSALPTFEAVLMEQLGAASRVSLHLPMFSPEFAEAASSVHIEKPASPLPTFPILVPFTEDNGSVSPVSSVESQSSEEAAGSDNNGSSATQSSPAPAAVAVAAPEAVPIQVASAVIDLTMYDGPEEIDLTLETTDDEDSDDDDVVEVVQVNAGFKRSRALTERMSTAGGYNKSFRF